MQTLSGIFVWIVYLFFSVCLIKQAFHLEMIMGLHRSPPKERYQAERPVFKDISFDDSSF